MAKYNTDLVQTSAGSTGPAGPAGPITNMLSIQGTYTFSMTSPFFTIAYRYTLEKGDIWVADGASNHVYTDDTGYMQTTLTGFLTSTTKAFDVIMKRKEMRFNGLAPFPSQYPVGLDIGLLETDDDTIRFGLFKTGSDYGQPVLRNAKVNNPTKMNIQTLKFSLLILGAD